ncbi:MAG: hypothetical protein LW712_01000, partial [Burkholderiaceae bacterium]|nr:hypothetical protein [Burkholderiaceae bacterium]
VGLHASILDGATYRCLDEFGQGLTRQEHRIKISSQLWLDSDLWDDSGFHGDNVVQTHYIGKRCA